MGECCEANNRPSLNAVHRYYRDCLGQGFSGSVKTCHLHRSLSCNAETKDFARLTSHPVRGWTGKNKAFCSPGTQTGCRVIKMYCVPDQLFPTEQWREI